MSIALGTTASRAAAKSSFKLAVRSQATAAPKRLGPHYLVAHTKRVIPIIGATTVWLACFFVWPLACRDAVDWYNGVPSKTFKKN